MKPQFAVSVRFEVIARGSAPCSAGYRGLFEQVLPQVVAFGMLGPKNPDFQQMVTKLIEGLPHEAVKPGWTKDIEFQVSNEPPLKAVLTVTALSNGTAETEMG